MPTRESMPARAKRLIIGLDLFNHVPHANSPL
jgi:hypothetical protein